MPRVVLQKDEHDSDKVRLYTKTVTNIRGNRKTRWFLDAVLHEDAVEMIFDMAVTHEVEERGRVSVQIDATVIEDE